MYMKKTEKPKNCISFDGAFIRHLDILLYEDRMLHNQGRRNWDGTCPTLAYWRASFKIHSWMQLSHFRAVGRYENPGVPVLFGGHNLPPLIEIGLTDLPKFGDDMAPTAPPGMTGLHLLHTCPISRYIHTMPNRALMLRFAVHTPYIHSCTKLILEKLIFFFFERLSRCKNIQKYYYKWSSLAMTSLLKKFRNPNV